jgi:hypothetical protein
MKKILIISLFGLFAAHESSAMFARAFRVTAAAVLPAAVTFVYGSTRLEQDINSGSAQDLTYNSKDTTWAERVVRHTKNWRDQYRAIDQELTKRYIKEGKAPEGIEYPSSEYLKQYIVLFKERDLSLVEQERVSNLLKKVGYNEDLIHEIISKMFILNNSSDKQGIAIGAVGIGLKEEHLNYCMHLPFTQIILHEVNHYLGSTGHHIRTNIVGFDRVMEERCVELVAMEQIAQVFGSNVLRLSDLNPVSKKNLGIYIAQMNLKDDLVNKIKTIELMLLPMMINEGYISCAPTVRNIIADYVEREQLEEAQGLLEKLQKVEKAERTERV